MLTVPFLLAVSLLALCFLANSRVLCFTNTTMTLLCFVFLACLLICILDIYLFGWLVGLVCLLGSVGCYWLTRAPRRSAPLDLPAIHSLAGNKGLSTFHTTVVAFQQLSSPGAQRKRLLTMMTPMTSKRVRCRMSMNQPPAVWISKPVLSFSRCLFSLFKENESVGC